MEECRQVTVAVVHSAVCKELPWLEEVLWRIDFPGEVRVVCRETDVLARKWCKLHGISCEEFAPDFASHSEVIAPLLRNTRLAERADMAVIFWDGTPKEMANVMKKFVETGKPVLLFPARKPGKQDITLNTKVVQS